MNLVRVIVYVTGAINSHYFHHLLLLSLDVKKTIIAARHFTKSAVLKIFLTVENLLTVTKH